MSIKEKLYKGIFWNSISQFGAQGINLLITVILARLLVPQDFGILGMVTVLTAFLGYFTEFGFIGSLIQKKEVDEIDCNTVYWSTLVFAILLYLFVFFCAPLVSLFYHDARLTLVTRVLFANFLFSPLAFVPEALETKKLKYDKISLANLISLAVSGCVGLTLAYLKFGVWSLVFQQISMTFIRGLTLSFTTGWRPQLIFSFDRLKELAEFGIHFTMRNLILFFSQNIDMLLVGKFLGPVSTGIYSFAFRIAKYPTMKFWNIFGVMLYPAFVSFRDDRVRMRENFVKISLLGGIALVPFIISGFFLISPIIVLTVGDKWIAAVPIIKILAVYLIFHSISLGDESILIAAGELRKVNAVKVLTTLLLLIVGYFLTRIYGIIGMATLFTAISIINILVIKVFVLRSLSISFKMYFSNFQYLLELLWIFLSTFLVYHLLIISRYKNLFGVVLIGFIIAITDAYIFLKKNNLIDLKAKRINFSQLIIRV